MMTDSLIHIRDLLHAQFCYQMFITPIHLPIDKNIGNLPKWPVNS